MLHVVDQLRDELREVWRFRWAALAIAWGLCLAGWPAVFSMPDMFEAKARVFVDTRTSLKPLLEGVAADQDVESQVVMVRQALLGGPSLERVALEAGLVSSDASVEQRQSQIVGMAERIKIELEPSATRDPRIPNTFYRITYRDRNREKAIQVVGLLLDAFVADTFGTSRDGARVAQTFLEDQLKQYGERLTVAEGALAEFKRRNIGRVPGEEGGYFQRLEREESNVQRVEAALRVAQSRKAELGKQLRGEVPLVSSSRSTAGRGSRAGETPVDTASRIQQTQVMLDELLLQFTEKHPDVIAARQTLVDLKERQLEEIAAVRRGDPGAVAAAGASMNPVYQSIQLQLHETEVQIAALHGELSDYRSNVAELKRALNTAPEAEAEYKRLTRDYEVTQTQYSGLLQRLEQARVSEDAQRTGIVDFQIVDPPSAPFSPAFPTRPALIALVLIVALGAGAGVAWILGKLRPVFQHSRALAELTGLPVLGVVSLVWGERHRAALIRDYLRYAAAACLLFATAAAAVVMHERGSQLMSRLIS